MSNVSKPQVNPSESHVNQPTANPLTGSNPAGGTTLSCENTDFRPSRRMSVGCSHPQVFAGGVPRPLITGDNHEQIPTETNAKYGRKFPKFAASACSPHNLSA